MTKGKGAYFILLFALQSCASTPKSEPRDTATLTQLASLATEAQNCLNSGTAMSKLCKRFLRSYQDSGVAAMERFADELDDIYREDFNVGLDASEQTLTILNAVAYVNEQNRSR